MNARSNQANLNLEKHLALLKKLDLEVSLESLVRNILNRNLLLYEVYGYEDGKEVVFVGIFLARVDTLFDGKREMVITHAAAIDKTEIPMCSIICPIFEKLVLDENVRSIRVHTHKKGIEKFLEDNGYMFVESIYKKRI